MTSGTLQGSFLQQEGNTNSLVQFFAEVSNVTQGFPPFPQDPSSTSIVLGFSYNFSVFVNIPLLSGEVTVLLNNQPIPNLTPFTSATHVQSFGITVSNPMNQRLSFLFSESGEIQSGGSLQITATPYMNGLTLAPSPTTTSLPVVLEKLRRILQKVNKRDRKHILKVLCRHKHRTTSTCVIQRY